MATPNYDQMSMAELGRRLIDTTSDLVETQIALAKQELREDIRSTIRGAIWLVIGGVLLLLATMCLIGALVAGTAALTGLPLWLAAVIWLIIFAAIGAVCLYVGRGQLRIPPLQQTRTIAQEELQWAKQRLTPPAR